MTTNTHRNLPPGWRWVKLSEILFSLETGSRPKGGARGITTGVPSLSAEHMTRFGTFDFSDLRYVPLEYYKQMSKGHVKLDDILIVKDGATTGKVAIVTKAFPYKEAVINEHVFLCRLDKSVIEPSFVFYFLWSATGQTQIRESFQGAAIGGINQSFTERVIIPLPPLAEQQRIAARLNEEMAAVAQARQAAEEQLRAARELPAVYLRKVFENFDVKDIPKRYLGDFVISYRNGFGRRPKDSEENGVIVLRLADVTGGVINLDNPRRVSMTHDEIKMYCVEDGDLLFVRVNGSKDLVGRVAVVKDLPTIVAYNDHLIRVKITKAILPEYVKLVSETKSARNFIVEKASTSAGQLTINQEMIRSLEIPYLTLNKQKELVEKYRKMICDICQMVFDIESQLAEINQLPAALLREAFMGNL